MRPLPTGSETSSSQNIDSFSQATPIASLSCFIASESDLESETDVAEAGPGPKGLLRKRNRSPSIPRVESLRSLGPASTTSLADNDMSRPSTPILTGAPGSAFETSIPSSPGDISSVSLSEDPNSLGASFSELPPSRSPCSRPIMSGQKTNIPQFVMPSLVVPQRRPFSDVGRSLGKLKILVAGEEGIGKSSLILAVSQISDHIVHMDGIEKMPLSRPYEVHASTRPKPWWRYDMDDSTSSKRRRSSVVDEILDRNLCFVECPAKQQDSQMPSPAIRYAEEQILHLCKKNMDLSDIRALLTSGAGTNVDLVLYLLPCSGPGLDDISSMKSLQAVTNVIPVLARADQVACDYVGQIKEQLIAKLMEEDLDVFSFTEPELDRTSHHIYAISSATQPDYETIDASILMKSDYLPPMVETDLEKLVADILSLEGSMWLRHAAAAKAATWVQHRRQCGTIDTALTCRRGPAHTSSQSTPYGLFPSPGQQYWGRVEMSSWAETLRRSLSVQRLDLSRQLLYLKTSASGDMPLALRKRCQYRPDACLAPGSNTSHQDPLGLLEMVSQVKNGGQVTLELLSSLGVVGCIVAWIIRPELTHHWDIGFPTTICLT